MVIDLLVRFAVGSTQSGFNGPHGELQVHSQIPPSHGVAEYNYFPSPAQNSFNQGQFQPQHQLILVSFSPILLIVVVKNWLLVVEINWIYLILEVLLFALTLCLLLR
ncbi:hypothetical protein ACOSP7_013295 [Xanthoceras sorbifolium]